MGFSEVILSNMSQDIITSFISRFPGRVCTIAIVEETNRCCFIVSLLVMI
jgi:hypothetical protein